MCFAMSVSAHDAEEMTVLEDSLSAHAVTQSGSPSRSLSYRLRRPINFVKQVIGLFTDYDTTYVEPNHYNWSTLLQATTTYEDMVLHDTGIPSNLIFGSRPTASIGPYLGWGIFFLGYTFDLADISHQKPSKTEFELSFYTSFIGGDLFYRHTGNDFSLHHASFPDQTQVTAEDFTPYKHQMLNGINASMIGANLYYIFNRRRFSLPSAFSQSTVQKKSAGSLKLGLGISKHNITIDYKKLSEQIPPMKDITMVQNVKMDYMDYSLSFGYAYNWVFRRNWVMSIDLAPEVGYKRTHRSLWISDNQDQDTPAADYLHRFFISRGNVNFNATGRFGIVWNNGHHFAGMSLIAHNFNYRYKDLSMHNNFCTLNLYVGLNFLRKK